MVIKNKIVSKCQSVLKYLTLIILNYEHCSISDHFRGYSLIFTLPYLLIKFNPLVPNFSVVLTFSAYKDIENAFNLLLFFFAKKIILKFKTIILKSRGQYLSIQPQVKIEIHMGTEIFRNLWQNKIPNFYGTWTSLMSTIRLKI